MAIPEGKSLNGAKVLAITDDLEVSELLSELSMAHLGPQSEVECCAASSAIDRFDSGKHDLIVIDTQTRGIEALLLLSRFVDLQPKALTLFIAGPWDHDLICQALGSGAHDFLT